MTYEQLVEAHRRLNEEADLRLSQTINILKGAKKVGIDDFNILKVIGRGAFGKVMLVEKKDT
jgi:hypothetical protein